MAGVIPVEQWCLGVTLIKLGQKQRLRGQDVKHGHDCQCWWYCKSWCDSGDAKFKKSIMKHIKINIEIGQLWRYKQFIYQPVEQLQRRHVVMNFRSSVLGNLLLFSSLWTKYGVTHVLYWTLLNPSTTGLKPREHIHNPPFVGAPYKVCALNVFGLSIPFLWTQYVKDTWRGTPSNFVQMSTWTRAD